MTRRIRIAYTAIAAFTLLGGGASGQNEAGSKGDTSDFRVLPLDFNAEPTQQMMRAYLRRQAHEALDRRLAELNAALESRDGMLAYQEKRRESLKRSLGEMPERAPLNAVVTGAIPDDGFAIEKILFESQPGFHVTANLYRPAGPGPFPAILHPVGHTENGKASGDYQRANRLLAKHGFIVLCFDPIGQGERKQIFAANGKPELRASGEHQQLGVAPILLGRSLGSYMVWDGVRAIDYLCSRADVDSRRIGCTGNSGGGNLTSYLMAYDDRIAAAAPGCFLTTHRHKNEHPGPGDAEQNLYSQIHDGFDHPDFILARAPRPTLILAATHDFVPVDGAWQAYREAKRAYTLWGSPERVALIEANAKHGFSRSLREGAVRFFALWLQERQIEVAEGDDAPIRPDGELQVTPDGQVQRLPGERLMFDLLADDARRLAAQRPPLTRDLVRRVAGVRPLERLPQPTVELLQASAASIDPHEPEKRILRPEPGIALPALHWPRGNAEPVLIAPADGFNAAVKSARQWNANGHPVLIVEVRDTGETKTRNWRFFGADYYIAHLLGRSWLGMQTEDLLVSARWLQEKHHAQSIRLVADGQVGPAAQHAGALEPQLIRSTEVTGGLDSWRELMRASDAQQHLHSVVQSALRHYDFPDLKKLERGAARE